MRSLVKGRWYAGMIIVSTTVARRGGVVVVENANRMT